MRLVGQFLSSGVGKSSHLLALALFMASPLAVQAEEQSRFQNSPFGYFGIGLDTLSYQESVGDLLGVSVETDYRATAPVQVAGGHTAMNDRWGFTISTLSTLFSEDESEDWNASGYGAIQQTLMSLTRQELNVLGAYQLQNGHYLLGGVSYSNVSFSRHHFSSAKGTDAFRTERLKPGQTFDPDAIEGAISEEQVTLNLRAGLGYDSYFLNTDKGLRLMYEATLGIPMYRRVTNSYLNAELTDVFSKGVSVNAAFGIGWQFSRHISVMYRIEAMYVSQDELREGNLMVPEVEMYGMTNSAVVYWNF